jgi:TrmH family RNA methyltransferase
MNEPTILSRFRVVLWRPKSPGNVGSVARAMKNMGFERLRIADPMRYEDPGFFKREAARMAWGASDLLERREERATIAAAVSDAVLLVGVSARPPAGRRGDSPRVLAPQLLEVASRGPVALLFGQEDIGLTDGALARCQTIATIPSSASYGSLNVAQAVLLVLYEIRLAALADSGSRPDSPRTEADPPPTQKEIDACLSRLSAALDSIGYFSGSGRRRSERDLRATLGAVVATRHGLGILEGIAHRIRVERRRSGA